MRCASRIRQATLSIALLAAFGISRSAHAGIDIEIGNVTEVLEQNIREFLSLTRYSTRDDLDAETVARLERRIPTEVRTALEPLGYYSATAKFTSTQEGNQWKVHIDVDPGRAVRLSEVKIEITGAGHDNGTLAAIIARDDLHAGGRLDHGVYESVKAELLRVATNDGYLDARLTKHEIVVDVEERRASIALSLETGERYKFGAITFKQPVLKEAAAARLLRMKEGDPYSLDHLLESQYVLDDSQYFTNVEFAPGTPDRETHEVPLAVSADKNRRNLYAPSLGYGTDTRVRGKFIWDNRYVNDSGHRTRVQIIASAVGQEANATYAIPVMDIALEKFEITATGKKEELGDITSRRTELAFGLTQALGTWQRVTFIRFSNETNEGTSPVPIPDHAFLIIPGISYSTLPPSLFERAPRRYSVYVELTGSPETLGSDATFLQLRVQTERVFDLAKRWHLRLRGQVGVTWSSNFDTLPASHRFFAGGDNSVRGFGLNELSPTINGIRIGGRHLLVGSAEVERDLPKNFGAVVFYDTGNAFDNFGDKLEYSVGVGARYRIAGIASVGADVAQPLSQSGRSPRFHLRLTTLF